MTPEKKTQIENLVREAMRAKERADALAMMSVSTDPKEREDQAVRYALAKAEAYETHVAAQRAIESP